MITNYRYYYSLFLLEMFFFWFVLFLTLCHINWLIHTWGYEHRRVDIVKIIFVLRHWQTNNLLFINCTEANPPPPLHCLILPHPYNL